MNEESKMGVYTADLTAEEMDADVVTVEPDRYKSADGVSWIDSDAKPKDRKNERAFSVAVGGVSRKGDRRRSRACAWWLFALRTATVLP